MTHGGHVLTDEDRMKKTGKRSGGTSIVNAIKNRTKCDSKCKIFTICPMMPLSQSRQNALQTCLLNAGGNALIRQFINTFVSGEAGLVNQINYILYHYGMDIETAPASVKKDYAQLLMQWHKQKFGDPRLVQEAKPNLTVVINEMGQDGKIIEVPIVPIVDVGPIRNKRNDVILDAMVNKNLEQDPESLLGSPIVDELMKNVPTFSKFTPGTRNTNKDESGRFARKEITDGIPEQDTRAPGNEPTGTESEPEKLAESPVTAGGGS